LLKAQALKEFFFLFLQGSQFIIGGRLWWGCLVLLVVGLSFLLDTVEPPAHILVLEVGTRLWVSVLLPRIVVVVDTFVVYQVITSTIATCWSSILVCRLLLVVLLVIVIVFICISCVHHLVINLL
jgi:hypothetical protein